MKLTQLVVLPCWWRSANVDDRVGMDQAGTYTCTRPCSAMQNRAHRI
jgi:hypothetical protein